DESEETIHAIRTGAVDAILVEGPDGEKVYTQESADRPYRMLVESMKEGALTLGADAVVLYCNPHFAEMLGASADSLTGRNLCDLVVATDRDECLRMFELAKAMPAEGEVLLERTDGTAIPVHFTLSPLPRGGAAIVCGIVTDLTEHKHNVQLRITQAALSESEARYRVADKHKDEFLAILAHELRNPLAPATNALHILQMKAPPIPEVQWAREVIATQVQRMTRLIDDLMDVSRITSNKLTLRVERVELGNVVEEALTATRPFIEESGHEMTVTLPRERVYLNADLVRLAQVLANLLTNAAKYTNPGGRISLRAERQGGEAVITVKDSGIGIPQELLPRVFDMFMQGDRTLTRRHGGLGIGLTLVKRLVEMHGGSVDARSEGKDKGSEFTIRVPALVDPVKADPETAQNHDSLPRSHRRILVVDDNELSANSLSILLGMAGNETRTAYGGPEALEMAEKFHPHVVLLDLGLPTMDGYETCVRLREQPGGKDVLIVALTGWGQAEDRRRSSEAGFDRHIVKPADPVELMKMVAELEAAKEQARSMP
ncbi:MAG TPA: ATP-binding protein, partial [Gemmatimonadales bacterium]|nr:ATP-binding protein [Gemmatimonadales bacterium]